jgi:DNA polymerase-3 subunit gamma/tau
VVGQEHVTEPLSTALDTGRISHAYLFSGPRGCGKTSSARILARSLNCVEGPTSRPCGVCASCVALGPGGAGNLDVIELDAASHGGVDDTRELRDRAFYAPAESRYRVFIVDEAHMVTTAGFNALLKIVEEPPAHLIFVFATTEPDKVLPTIRSRTHHYPFRLLPPATMRGLLGTICEQEGVPVEEAVYPLVIRAGGGSPRDSLSVLDQLLAGAGPDGVTYPRALALLGVTDIALIDDAVEALAADDGAALFGTVDRVVEAGHDPRRFAGDLLERMRDLILLRAVPDAADRNLVTGPGDVLERMRDQAQRLGQAALTRYAELLHEGLGEMRGATAPRLLLEVVCARMLLPNASDSESATLQRLERLERQVAGGAVAPAPPSVGQAPAQAAAPAAQSESSGRAPAEPQQSGPPRRRGAEALAAIRENRSGGSPSAPKGANSPVPDAPTHQQFEQRPHPAQRAQSPGPESGRSQQNPDAAPVNPVPEASTPPVSAGPSGDDPHASSAVGTSDEHAPRNAPRSADNATSRPTADGDPADRAAVSPDDSPTRTPATERQNAGRPPSNDPAAAGAAEPTTDASACPAAGSRGGSGADESVRPGVLERSEAGADASVRPAAAESRGAAGASARPPEVELPGASGSDALTRLAVVDSSNVPAGSEYGALQGDSQYSSSPESTAFAFSPGVMDVESHAPQVDSTEPGSSEPDVQPLGDDRQSRQPTSSAAPAAASRVAGSGNAAPQQSSGAVNEQSGAAAEVASSDPRSPQAGASSHVSAAEFAADQESQTSGGAPDRDTAMPRQSRAADTSSAGSAGGPHGSDDAYAAEGGASARPSADETDSGAADSGYPSGRTETAESRPGAKSAVPQAQTPGVEVPARTSAGRGDSGADDSGYAPEGGESGDLPRAAESVTSPQQPPASGDAALREVEAAWGDIRTKVREFGAAVHALLSGASVARLEGETVVLAHQHAPLAQRLANPKYVEAVQSAIHAVLGRRYEVRWEVAEASSGGARPEPPARPQPQPASGRGAPARAAEPPKFTRPSQARGATPDAGAAPRAQRPAGGDSGERSGGGSVTRATPPSDAPAPPDDDIPLPDGPDLPDDPGPEDYSPVGYDGVPPASTPEEEREMLAESARPVPPQDRRDPDEVALELLSAELGATRLEA